MYPEVATDLLLGATMIRSFIFTGARSQITHQFNKDLFFLFRSEFWSRSICKISSVAARSFNMNCDKKIVQQLGGSEDLSVLDRRSWRSLCVSTLNILELSDLDSCAFQGMNLGLLKNLDQKRNQGNKFPHSFPPATLIIFLSCHLIRLIFFLTVFVQNTIPTLTIKLREHIVGAQHSQNVFIPPVPL